MDHIRWKDNNAIAVIIPKEMIRNVPPDSMSQWIAVSLASDSLATHILGVYKLENDLLFEPMIPFTRGLTYKVVLQEQELFRFTIPADTAAQPPSLTAIYPQADTLPENLLKIYLQFSQPMRENQSEHYVRLIKDGRDTLSNEFLNLKPELWNDDRTVLTLWLDPGRIKRDLQPNLRLGSPLKNNVTYELIVDHHWQNLQGLSLKKNYSKSFVTTVRDSVSPDPAYWQLAIPAANSNNALVIDTKESLDYFLLKECLYVLNDDSTAVKGNFMVNSSANHVQFIPSYAWRSGNYTLVIETRLEDLAGNNINRPFDRDIFLQKKVSTAAVYRKNFSVK